MWRIPMYKSRSAHSLKASAYMYESLKDERTKGSGDADKAAFTLAYRTDVSFFSWLELPENEYAVKRFAKSMHAAEGMHNNEDGAVEGVLYLCGSISTLIETRWYQVSTGVASEPDR